MSNSLIEYEMMIIAKSAEDLCNDKSMKRDTFVVEMLDRHPQLTVQEAKLMWYAIQEVWSGK